MARAECMLLHRQNTAQCLVWAILSIRLFRADVNRWVGVPGHASVRGLASCAFASPGPHEIFPRNVRERTESRHPDRYSDRTAGFLPPLDSWRTEALVSHWNEGLFFRAICEDSFGNKVKGDAREAADPGAIETIELRGGSLAASGPTEFAALRGASLHRDESSSDARPCRQYAHPGSSGRRRHSD